MCEVHSVGTCSSVTLIMQQHSLSLAQWCQVPNARERQRPLLLFLFHTPSSAKCGICRYNPHSMWLSLQSFRYWVRNMLSCIYCICTGMLHFLLCLSHIHFLSLSLKVFLTQILTFISVNKFYFCALFCIFIFKLTFVFVPVLTHLTQCGHCHTMRNLRQDMQMWGDEVLVCDAK